MADKNFVVKTGLTAGEFVVDSATGAFTSSTSGIQKIKENLGLASSTGSLLVPSGTTAERDASPTLGTLRFNTDTTLFEIYDGTNWRSLSTSSAGGSSTGSTQLPTGTTAQRDTVPVAGLIRFNTETFLFEGYNGTSWVTLDSIDGGTY